MSNSLYTIQMTRRLSCSAEEAYHVVEDIERFPEFMPSVNTIQLLETEGNRKVARWDTTIDDAPLEWVEEGVYELDKLRVRFRSLEGVFDRFDGYWQVVDDGGGSLVAFELIYEIGLPEIEDIVGPILRERLVENAESMLDAIERRLADSS